MAYTTKQQREETRSNQLSQDVGLAEYFQYFTFTQVIFK